MSENLEEVANKIAPSLTEAVMQLTAVLIENEKNREERESRENEQAEKLINNTSEMVGNQSKISYKLLSSLPGTVKMLFGFFLGLLTHHFN